MSTNGVDESKEATKPLDAVFPITARELVKQQRDAIARYFGYSSYEGVREWNSRLADQIKIKIPLRTAVEKPRVVYDAAQFPYFMRDGRLFWTSRSGVEYEWAVTKGDIQKSIAFYTALADLFDRPTETVYVTEDE